MTDNSSTDMGTILNKAHADAFPFWEAFVAAAKAFAEHLDQFEKVKFRTEHGMVYVSMSRDDYYPDSFTEITDE